jgi:uncharacterized protein with PIN domain
MGFNCLCDVGVDDFAEMIETRVNKARKEHKCHECQELIKPGEKYLVEKEVFDGRLSTHKTCLRCKEVRDAYLSAFYWGRVWEDLRECFDDIPMRDYEKFSKEAQIKILELL